MKMTYRNLKEQLDKFTEEQLNCDVSILNDREDEFYEVERLIEFANPADNDVLDEGHPFIIIKD